MKRYRPLFYWIAGAAAVALVIAFFVAGRLYTQWREDHAVIPLEHVVITLVKEREEVHDGHAKYIFVYDIVFPKDCECTIADQESSISEDRCLAAGEVYVRKPPRNVRLVVTHLYNVEKQIGEASYEMTSNDPGKVVHKSSSTFDYPRAKIKFEAKSCKLKVSLLPTGHTTFPADLLVISTQNAPPGPSATHQMLTLIRVSGPAGSAPDVREAEFDSLAREYRLREVKNDQ